jgi:hypothetical protein
MFAVLYGSSGKTVTINFGYKSQLFPSKKDLVNVVLDKREEDEPQDIVVLSICELSENDFEKFWSE